MRFNQVVWGLLILAVTALMHSARAQDNQPEYQLGAGDLIRVIVFQNPDLTVETRVTENGTVTYPLLGSVKIGGMTIPAAEQVIAKGLKAGNYIESPQVNISLLQNRGNQVSVLGSVNRAGRFPLETVNTRFSEMIAIAGGLSPTAGDIAIVTGVRNGKPMRREIDIAGMFLGNRPEDDFVVSGGDVIYVHRMPVYYIYGEVQRPGSYRVERSMTVRQAVAQGGGMTIRGTQRGLTVNRRGADGKTEVITPELQDPIQPDDVIYVQESLF